jgi:hypothetical protein
MADDKTRRNSAGCDITRTDQHLRARVGFGLASEVQACYRALSSECLQRGCSRVLVLGEARIDPVYHLAMRDALRSMALAGVPHDFRLALVALTPGLIPIYDAVIAEAQRLGIEARRFMTEADAEGWLKGQGSGP